MSQLEIAKRSMNASTPSYPTRTSLTDRSIPVPNPWMVGVLAMAVFGVLDLAVTGWVASRSRR